MFFHWQRCKICATVLGGGWRRRGAPSDLFYASGSGGQGMYVAPSLGIVTVHFGKGGVLQTTRCCSNVYSLRPSDSGGSRRDSAERLGPATTHRPG